MASKKIRIWFEPGRPHGLRQYREPAYCWECPCCGPKCRGRNSFNRFTDYARAGRGGTLAKTYVHPWQRCVNAVELHLWRRHRNGTSGTDSGN